MLIAPDDGIVVDVAEHFEEIVSVRIAELAQSVDARFDAVDRRFDVVDAELKTVARFDEVQQGFLEQRDYATFCLDKLREEMRGEFDKVKANFDEVHAKFGEVHAKFGDVKTNFGRIERRLDRHEELLGELLAEVRSLKPK